MMSLGNKIFACILLCAGILIGCGGSKNNPVNPSNFTIQVTNNPDNFLFVAADAQDESRLIDYTWINSGTQATITHTSTVDSGTALLYLYDGSGNLVYSNGLATNVTEQSQIGAPGNWLVRVSLNLCWGDLNFQVQGQ